MIKLTENQREILQALLDGKDIEATDVNGNRYTLGNYLEFITAVSSFRGVHVKPRTITVNGVEVPEPMKVKPEVGKQYYIPRRTHSTYLEWCNDDIDNEYFNDGICHSTPEAATLHWEAMIKPSRVN